jgi:hypothetical protein
MTRHVSAETMAGFRQGDLSPRKSSRISAHLAGCDRCRTLDEGLAGVRTLLAGAQPPPIPEHLAARIQTALATEAAGRVVRPAGSENGIGTAAPGLGRPMRAPGRPMRAPSWLPHLPHLPRVGSRVALGSLAAAAAVLVVAGGMYEMYISRGSASGPSGAAASAPGHRPAGPSAGSNVALPAPSGAASRTVLQYRHSGHEDSITPVTTDTDFTPGRLGTQAAAAVARYGTAIANAAPNTNPLAGAHSAAAAPAKQPATFGNMPVSLLQGCVNRIDAGGLVLLVDVARYRGTPATVIVTEVTVIGPEQIWVVSADCSGSHSDVLTRATMAAP